MIGPLEPNQIQYFSRSQIFPQINLFLLSHSVYYNT